MKTTNAIAWIICQYLDYTQGKHTEQEQLYLDQVKHVYDKIAELERWKNWAISIHPELDTQAPTINETDAPS